MLLFSFGFSFLNKKLLEHEASIRNIDQAWKVWKQFHHLNFTSYTHKPVYTATCPKKFQNEEIKQNTVVRSHL